MQERRQKQERIKSLEVDLERACQELDHLMSTNKSKDDTLHDKKINELEIRISYMGGMKLELEKQLQANSNN
jgi:hypothetical protein